jgi:ParB family chromosome partitioning protein
MTKAATHRGTNAVKKLLNRQMSGKAGVAANGSAAGPLTAATDTAYAANILQANREIDPSLIEEVSLSRVVDNPFNARHVYRQDRVEEMVESIRQNGQMTPAHAFPIEGRPGYWQLIDGQFRKRALMLAGKDVMKVLPVTPCSELELYKLSFLLNHERTEQTAYDNALSWKRLIDEKIVSDQEELAATIGVSKATISKTLAMLDLPAEVVQLMRDHAGKFGTTLAYALFLYSKTPNQTEAKVKELFWKIVEEDLGSRDVDRIREQVSKASGPQVREHSTTYPLRLPEGVRGSLKVWSKQGRLSVDVRNLPEDKLMSLQDGVLDLMKALTQ